MPLLDVDLSNNKTDNYWLLDELFESEKAHDRSEEYLIARLEELRDELASLKVRKKTRTEDLGNVESEEHLTKIKMDSVFDKLKELRKDQAQTRIIMGQLTSYFSNVIGERGSVSDFHSLCDHFSNLPEEEKDRVHMALVSHTRTWRIEQRMLLGNIIARNRATA